MSHHIEDLVNSWQAAPDDDWVLVVITRVEGSAYRKVGAMMLIHSLGKSVGVISGGCLEADLKRYAQKALQTQQALSVCYDASDESDASYQLGCGGVVHLMLIPLCRENHYLNFPTLSQALKLGGRCYYQLSLCHSRAPQGAITTAVWASQAQIDKQALSLQLSDFNRAGIHQSEQATLVIPLRSRYRIAIFGGGLDAQPVCRIAMELGWQVDVVDERTSYARSHDFVGARVLKLPIEALDASFWHGLDGAIIMHHNLSLDAKALASLHTNGVNIAYIALLGPGHRRDCVLALAELTSDAIKPFFSAPAGLALGGELPASIALSILSECHGVLHQAKLGALQEVML
ncbi:XdhC family protein [Shewanella algidipiscicola]|uniref:Xanthine and CO dehydrogenase family maturation factor XdhC/CoxF family protein n=1 Tax=Shewanella algidipiscicola TaxID=614070 RepID=A0ABQ4P5Y6_9GAMM|nr:XdhC/CoxI family protein [Shewanella algidipiscicola]GIU42838.1 xanthine and CO dehydrogenase family maturation factor XdhC/CoxF family protein [Shewanella algidipiscicola]